MKITFSIILFFAISFYVHLDTLAQDGSFIDLEQGPELLHGVKTPEPYFAGFRSGYSRVWIRREYMSSSWFFYTDAVIGLYRANPGAITTLGITFHLFLCDWVNSGFPSSKVLGFYFFSEPGYVFSWWNSPDVLGNSWYTTSGFELGAGGVFLSLSLQSIWRSKTLIPQIGGKIYLF
jgi:hypothetical protein